MPHPDPRTPMLVIGTGELGQALLHALLPRAAEASVRIDVLVRSEPSPDAPFVRAGGHPVQCDVAGASAADLAELFSRYDTVVSCLGFAVGSGTQLKLAHAALASGVRRYSPWQFGADYDVLGRGGQQPLFDEQLDVRDLLRGQDAMRWIIVSVGMFTSFLFEPSFGVVELEGGVVRALGGRDNAVTLTTPDDIGHLTRQVLASIDDLLVRAGSGRDRLLRATVLLADMADYDAMNRVWDEWVRDVGKPVRATYGVGPATPRYAVEIIVTAACD